MMLNGRHGRYAPRVYTSSELSHSKSYSSSNHRVDALLCPNRILRLTLVKHSIADQYGPAESIFVRAPVQIISILAELTLLLMDRDSLGARTKAQTQPLLSPLPSGVCSRI